MGALSMLMIEAEDAINKLGKKPLENDGYNFKVDSETWSTDDYVIRAGHDDFVLAVAWLNPPEGCKPRMPNLNKAFENSGLKVIDKSEYDRLKEIESKFNSLAESGFLDTDVNRFKSDYKIMGVDTGRIHTNYPIIQDIKD